MTAEPDVGLGPRALSLCSGIAGLDYATRVVLGARVIAYVEGDAACLDILASRMEEGRLDPAPVWSDVRSFDGTQWRGCVDLVTAGYPCQPFSSAGKRRGAQDRRHLWPEVRRVIRETRPTAVVLENVRGHLGNGFDRVLADLADLGMDAVWGVYPATAAQLPHRRERLFVVAYSRRGGRESLRSSWIQHSQRQAYGDNHDRCREGLGFAPPGPDGDWSRIPEQFWPTLVPQVHRVADGVLGRVDRLRALGNAVSPAQAIYALRDLIGRLY